MSKPSKFKNQSVTIDGRKFASTLEAARYLELRDMEKKGLILDLECQVRFELVAKTKTMAAASYVADFQYKRSAVGITTTIVEDAKGMRTALFNLKNKILAEKGIVLTLIKKEDLTPGYYDLAKGIRDLGLDYSTGIK